MATIDYGAYGLVDLTPAFSVTPQQNYLLQALNIFETQPSDTIKIAFDRIVESNKSLLNDPKKRYSFEHNSTARGDATNFLIECPYFLRSDQVSAADFQRGNRRPGRDDEETFDSIVADYIQKHATAHRRTLEQYYANALFRGQVITPETDDKLIDYAKSFDAPFLTANVDLTAANADVLEILSGLYDQVADSAEGLYSNMIRVVAFAGRNVYNKLRFHPGMKSAFTYVSPLDAGNIITQRRELLPNVQTMTVPGLSLDVVSVADPLLTQYIGPDELILVPVFRAGTNAYSHIYTPASTNTRLARTGVAQEYFSYMIEKDLGETDVYFEASILPVNNVTNMILKVSVKS